MESKHLTYFKIENFKRFESLEINKIGQFNLIVGDNNVGKTTLLESLLFDDENYNQLLSNLLNALIQIRKIPFLESYQQLDTLDYISLFTKDKGKPIEFNFKFKGNINKQSLSIEGLTKSELKQNELNQLGTKNIIHQTSNFLIRISNPTIKELRYTTFHKEVGSFTQYYPLTSFGLTYQHDLVAFFSEVSKKTSAYNCLVEELRAILPNIISIEISNAIIKDFLVVSIRETDNEELRPISFYGDGINKFFRFLLEVFLCENKRLMIDEIDTGIHYSRMKDNFKSVIKLAFDNNVQLFATTHSKECLQYFKEALEELGFQDKGRVIRLVEHKQKEVKAYTYTFEQFEQSIDNDNEIR
jgi:AAA15 family ATPase/GTPase